MHIRQVCGIFSALALVLLVSSGSAQEFHDRLTNIVERLKEVEHGLLGWRGKALVQLKEQTVGLVAGPDGAKHENPVLAATDVNLEFWLDELPGARLSTKYENGSPPIFSERGGERLFGYERPEPREVYSLVSKDKVIWFSKNELLGEIPGMGPSSVVGKPFTSVCYSNSLAKSSLAKAITLDPRTVCSFGHRAEEHQAWSNSVSGLLSEEGLEFELGAITDAPEEEIVWVRVWDSSAPDFVELEYAFFSRKGFLPAWYVHREQKKDILEQKWHWKRAHGRWVPASYELNYENGGAPGQWQTWQITTESLGDVPADVDLDVSALPLSKYDRYLNLEKDELLCFNGTEFVPMSECVNGSKPTRDRFTALWLLLTGAGIVAFFWKKSR